MKYPNGTRGEPWTSEEAWNTTHVLRRDRDGDMHQYPCPACEQEDAIPYDEWKEQK